MSNAKTDQDKPDEKEGTKPVQAHIPKSLHAKFKGKVALQGTDITTVLTELITKWVEE